jgi:hypothetical protein
MLHNLKFTLYFGHLCGGIDKDQSPLALVLIPLGNVPPHGEPNLEGFFI